MQPSGERDARFVPQLATESVVSARPNEGGGGRSGSDESNEGEREGVHYEQTVRGGGGGGGGDITTTRLLPRGFTIGGGGTLLTFSPSPLLTFSPSHPLTLFFPAAT
jgi:hypothetical protein